MKLFESELKVINIGLESFRQGLNDTGVKNVQVQFKPPLSQEAALFAKAAKFSARIEKANAKAMEKILAARGICSPFKPRG